MKPNKLSKSQVGLGIVVVGGFELGFPTCFLSKVHCQRDAAIGVTVAHSVKQQLPLFSVGKTEGEGFILPPAAAAKATEISFPRIESRVRI